MSQTRNHEFKAPLISDVENRRHLGQYFPGVYCGFDQVVYIGTGSDFTLAHGISGVVTTKQDNTLNAATGVICTKHGTVIAEDAAIGPFTLGSNVGNGSDRYDLIYLEHNRILVAGGQVATYGIQQGPFGNPTIPALTSPNNKILIAVIKIKAGATATQALNDIITPPVLPTESKGVFTRELAQDIGGIFSAKLPLANKFTKQNAFASFANLPISYITGDDYQVELNEQSNRYNQVATGSNPIIALRSLRIPKMGEGTRIMIKQTQPEALAFYHLHATVGANQAGINIPTPYINYPTYGTNGSLVINHNDMVELEYVSGFWRIVNVMFHSSVAAQAYMNLFKTPQASIFTFVRNGVGAGGTSLTYQSTIINPGINGIGVSGNELVFSQTAKYGIKMIWQLRGDASAIELVEFSTNSSNDPDLGYQDTELTTHRKYDYGGATPIWQDKMQEQVEWVGSFNSGSKFGPYITLSTSSANVKCIVEITWLF